MNIIAQLNRTLANLKVLRASGHNVAYEIRTVEDAITVVTQIHELVDGKECDSSTTSALIDVLTTYGLAVASPEESQS